MSLASGYKISAKLPIYPSWNVLSLLSSTFTALTFLIFLHHMPRLALREKAGSREVGMPGVFWGSPKRVLMALTQNLPTVSSIPNTKLVSEKDMVGWC